MAFNWCRLDWKQVVKKCRQCLDSFETTPDEESQRRLVAVKVGSQEFPIPEPSLCPLCRLQQRMVWRAELHLYKRKSSRSNRDIISYYPPEIPHKIYHREEFWSDDWNALDYGRDFDFTRPFFEQFSELMLEVPLLALSGNNNEENSEYINNASWNKNCYLVAGANYSENCYYGHYINHCKSSVDNSHIHHCELCYDCIECSHSYNLHHSFNAHNCIDCYFLDSCRSCTNCFGCVNLANSQYCFFNEQLTADEYKKRVSNLGLNTRSARQEISAKFEEFRIKHPRRFIIGDMNENVSGNGISNSKNCHNCFDVSGSEDCINCVWLHNSKTCGDILSWGFSAECCYQCTEVGNDSNNVAFCVTTYGGHKLYYCYTTFQSKECFGSIGLRRGQNVILNKQYNKPDYDALLARIIEHMKDTGEWGEFFPVSVCPLPYNTSIAQERFPITEAEANKLGIAWHTETELPIPADAIRTIPEDINTVDESICDKVLICKETGKPFKITRPEFKFYKQAGVPLPDEAFFPRHMKRYAKRNPPQLWDRDCAQCHKSLQTSYAPYKKDIVYCDDCYRALVY